ncbi:LTA synthase family protein [Paenibacillus beijingensis]|uniref:Sulfatase n=1 Tax=Paenibacillus beijingensis TaxID=1126833 RepID=A0A0D5NN70_9BACL|nr:LTA synthase family protein [Paenibacillus beijingensis]AJY76706.1 sulfatase [Paenibacillus beijingensis]
MIRSFSKPSYNRTLYYAAFIVLLLKLTLLRYFLFKGVLPLPLLADALSILIPLSLLELIVPSKWKGPVYWVFNAIFSLLLFAITLYFHHFSSVPTYTALGEIKQVFAIRASVKSTISPTDFLFFVDIVLIAMYWIIRKIRGIRVPGRRPIRKSAVAATVVVALLGSGWLIMRNQSITNELALAETIGVFDYQVTAVIKAKQEAKEIASGNINETIGEINQLRSSYAYQNASNKAPLFFGATKGKNLIIVQLEAFQNFPVHLKLDGKEITPNLNKLADEGFYFPHIFQQIGQGNTSDAEFMSNTSIYPTGTIAMSTGYGNRNLPSLPKLLEQENYVTNTFHINSVGFWDRIKMYPALGFNKYYDKPYYNNDHFNDFGASDEELYRVAVEKMSEHKRQNQSFYAQIVTTSGHFPFQVPEDRKQITIPDSLEGTELGNYFTAVNYTDYAVGKLIERLKAANLWEDTTLVLYGDHFGLQPQDIDPQEAKRTLGITYDPRITRFNIPLIIHTAGSKSGQVVNQVGGQVDIMPTVANLMGISLKEKQYTAFGQDLLNIDRNVIGMRYYLPTGSFFNNDILFVPGNGFEDGSAISLKTLQPVADFSKYRSDYDYVLKLMNLSDKYVKLLPKR